MKYTAHIRNKDGKIQTVKEHCLSAAEKGKNYAEKFGAGTIAYIQGLFHDAGKLTDKFNEYVCGNSDCTRGEIDHSYAGARYLYELAHKLDRADIIHVSKLIARTIISHHGLHDWISDEGEDYFSQRTSKDDFYEEILGNIPELCSEAELMGLLEEAVGEYNSIRSTIKEISCKDAVKYGFYMGMLERLMQSVLIDADRTDTADFMSDSKTEKVFDTQKLWAEMHDKMEQKLSSFSSAADRISMQRRSISERCRDFAVNKSGVVRLIVPTGGGKTLSSLRFAIEYCKRHGGEKIIYTAPFMSILEQNSDEIRSIAGEQAFLEHHSNIIADIDSENDLQEYELRTEKWDSPVIATTMVQFLNTLFSGKTSCVRRMHRLAKSVIIIDEVQSVPMKCVNMFNLAINFLSKICGCTVVLCSATQPVLDETDYPLIVDENSSMTGDWTQDFEVFRRTEIVPCIEPCGYSFEQAADFCFEKYEENGNLLVVVNTKAAALRIFELVREQAGDSAEIIHLSTSMCPEHRRNKIRDVREHLEAKRPVICITTQLIEAGVDISFKCVVRSLAGMDNAAQAAGRCNRHGEADGICSVYVINITDEKLGSLKEIKEAQEASEQLIYSERYDDYLSVETLSDYFRKLYTMERDKLSYNVVDGDSSTTLLGLLSLNSDRYNVRKKLENKYCGQAFKTAGSLFEVIDSRTVDVIVPYNDEARDIIDRLNSDIKPDEALELLRKSQKYTVGIYSGTNIKLAENSALNILGCGAAVLKEEFYNMELGVVTEGAMQETLIF
ncbi:MAG: CRISPR-associated helicase Cas3' [Ruminococcus sp.]|nr:CRISPR-associated helicase Cas3' [Ruminococcus sp.]